MSPDEYGTTDPESEPVGGRTSAWRPGRRELLKSLGGGVLILVAAGPAGAVQEEGRRRRGGGGGGAPQEIGAWLHVGGDGAVTVFTGKVELGQNIRTELTQVVAEELRAQPAAVKLIMGDTDLCPFDMGTFGSLTTPTMVPQLRRAAAAARGLLVGEAAKQWGADPSTLTAEAGTVKAASGGRSATYGQLAQGRKLVETIGDPGLTPATAWKVAGRSLPKIGGRAYVTGEVKFVSDVSLPGMLHGKALHPPVLGAKAVNVDTSAAEAMPQVQVVSDGDFVGVVAPDVLTAERAVAAIKCRWESPELPSHPELFDYLTANVSGEQVVHSQGSVEEGARGAAKTLRGTYTVAYIAHVPLEPRAGVAEWRDGRLTAWLGTQRPFGNKSDLAAACGVPEDRVHGIAVPVGGAYGGKQTCEAAIEAARLSKAVGKPVKVVWTREDEFRLAYFRPAGVIQVSSGIDRDGKLVSWEFHNTNSGTAGIGIYYEVPNQRIVYHNARSPLRQGSYRALAAPANQFARETHIDELAQLVGMDPLAFRLKNLPEGRLRDALQAAAKAFGWGRKPAAGHGFGIACGFEKGGYVGTCAEVAVDKSGAVRIVRVVTAFDPGPVINPDHMHNQMEGMQMMGLGGALFEAIRFTKGRIDNPRLASYRVPRFSDMPTIETLLMNRKDVTPAGGGECPMVALAPAVGGAIFAATGVRLRALPLVPDGKVRRANG